MRKRRIGGCLLAFCIMIGAAGCADGKGTDSAAKVDGLDKLGAIQVISREEGSGTRSAFAQLADFEADGEGGSATDKTRSDAEIVNNADEVIAAVVKNASAVGYVSEGALADDQTVNVLNIDGKSVQDTNGKYPLSRSFYLAYNGELSDLEQDFMTYVHSLGQEIVAETYEPVAKSSSFLSNKAEGVIKIDGSTSVAPLMEKLATAYMEINPNAVIQVTESDSTKGMNQAMSGECNLGMASRDLKDYEKELLDYEAIAQDDIAVIVNTDNPLKDITLKDLKDIYTGDMKAWEELNS
ncbi:substrate-binding domain-containing protein [Hespellia stercorisuis]|uniref:Phosphate ABC transporter substrate-binding protein, PhoT family (TC 3.A.1.7.1) n=1 Tax=Hespellia stercorisuis DSM 15480 TaxID=1121950 RepID=A0A1M6PBW9_9FIRM|nr:substrate-binding domain-containing protein [Hespellia stercorisuis]SHK05370.1 phosphate ABC transporter substrate-binding protein, PhoT family (TC 3.A.1.7.1) [Hespellia stercorisuis DSM 15480]